MAAISAAWSRVTGRAPTTGTGTGSKTLQADLKRITHSGVLDIPKELLTPVIEASVNEEDRPEIMKHLRECLAEPLGKHWRRIYGGLVLVEALIKSGSPALISETAEGRHFDLVQRLSFLEHFDNTDKRVMNNVRKKAEALRREVVPLLQGAVIKDAEDACKDTASTCSPGSVSTAVTHSTTATNSSATSGGYAGFGSDDMPSEASKPVENKRTMILNNIVSVGHNDDTTSESEGGEDKRAPVRFREQKKMSTKDRNDRSRRTQNSSSDSDDGSEPKQQSKPVVQAPAHTVDLLGL